MTLTVTLVVPTLNRYDLLDKLLDSVFRGSRIPDKTIIIDNGLGYSQPASLYDLNVWTIRFGRNLGVAGSCNKAMRFCEQLGSWWLHANDDAYFFPDTLEKLVNYAEQTNEPFVFPGEPCNNARGEFTVFLANPKVLLERVGEWDEQFYPAYFEDNDYGRRIIKAGLQRVYVPGCKYEHPISSTLRAYNKEQMAQHHRDFADNSQRYIRKWGGMPEHETFEVPYGGYPAEGCEVPGI